MHHVTVTASSGLPRNEVTERNVEVEHYYLYWDA